MNALDFKILVNDTKKIYEYDRVFFNKNKNSICFSTSSYQNDGWEFEFSLEEVTLLRYTGLKDKNDIKIYESDMVLVLEGESTSYHEVVFGDESETYPAFCLKPHYTEECNDFSFILNTFAEIEVIENAHINSEISCSKSCSEKSVLKEYLEEKIK